MIDFISQRADLPRIVSLHTLGFSLEDGSQRGSDRRDGPQCVINQQYAQTGQQDAGEQQNTVKRRGQAFAFLRFIGFGDGGIKTANKRYFVIAGKQIGRLHRDDRRAGGIDPSQGTWIFRLGHDPSGKIIRFIDVFPIRQKLPIARQAGEQFRIVAQYHLIVVEFDAT